MRNSRPITIVILAGVYVAVRVWRLDATCLWFDEMYSVHAAEHAWNEILSFIAMDLVHPPLFYMLLKGWIAMGGESVFWLRMLPVVFSTLAIAPFIFLAKELALPRWTSVFGLFLLTANGSLIKYTQEVRMYTMLMFVSLCSIWLFSRYFIRGKSWLALVTVNVILVYTHYYGWLVIGTEVLAIIAFQRIKWRRISGMATIVFAAFVPWMIYVLRYASTGSSLAENIDWIQRPTVPIFLNFCLDLIEPFYFQTSSLEPASVYKVSLPIVIIIVAGIVVYCAAEKAKATDSVKLLAWFSFLPLALALIGSWLLPFSIWGTRHMIVIVGPLMLVIAAIVMSLQMSQVRIGAITLLVFLSGYAFILQVQRPVTNYVWCGWGPLIEETNVGGNKPVSVYTSENLAAYHAWFATRNDDRFVINIVKPEEPSQVDKQYFPPRGNDGIHFVEINDIKGSNVILIYRTEPALTDWLRQDLEWRGYVSCPPVTREYGPSTAFRVEMTLPGGNCIYR